MSATTTHERTTGLRAVLSAPWAYELAQRAIGVHRYRQRLLADHLRPEPRSAILDIGCGPGSMLEVLPAGTYVGFDPSEAYIASAREHYGDRGTFFVGGVEDFDASALGSFDLVIAQGVLHHIDDDGGRSLFDLARDVLRPGGRVVTVDPCLSPGQPRIARSLITRDRGQHVRELEGYRSLATASFEDVDAVERNDLLRVPYTHAIVSAAA